MSHHDDLNIPDPDVLVNQLDLLVTAAAESENTRQEPRPRSQGMLCIIFCNSIESYRLNEDFHWKFSLCY